MIPIVGRLPLPSTYKLAVADGPLPFYGCGLGLISLGCNACGELSFGMFDKVEKVNQLGALPDCRRGAPPALKHKLANMYV